MKPSIIIAGERAIGKSVLGRTIAALFDDHEVLKLNAGHDSNRLFVERVIPNDNIRLVIVDSARSGEDIVYMDEYLRHIFHLYPSLKGIIFITNHPEVHRANQLLNNFSIFTLSEYLPELH